MRVTPLSANWQFRPRDIASEYDILYAATYTWRDAAVPGCIHTDLIRHGIIADPFALQYEAGCQWVDECDWTYQTSFEWTPDASLPKRVLRFDGLDTVCAVFLNDEQVAQNQNMFAPLEVDVASVLREGVNELRVEFESAVRIGKERRARYFAENGIPANVKWFEERAFVRKAQYMSGWDWGPRLVSCGIWQPVYLLEYSARITDFTVHQEPVANDGIRVWTETAIEGDPELTVSFDGKGTNGELDICIEEPRLWWPNGEGEQPLYTIEARLASGHSVTRRIGLRTIRLLRERDECGESFEFEVNGRRIYARGANWIPNGSFPSRISREEVFSQIDTCARLGMNMLRVWGGGLYESEDFYDACDEAGILVWQDFAYACSYYPDTGEYLAESQREAEIQVRRLRSRTSLALWCGNNENNVMWEHGWGGSRSEMARFFGERIYDIALPEVVERLDSSRPYVPSSPARAASADAPGINVNGWSDVHDWNVWHGEGDWIHYRKSAVRFSSEFGFASACGRAVWRSVYGHDIDNVAAFDQTAVWHDKTRKGSDTFRKYVETHYPPSTSLEDWTYFSQLNQRDALRCGIEHYRSLPQCRGTLIWQFNDCWPVQSWAVQDYSRELKPAGFEMRRLCSPAMIALRIDGSELQATVVNDSPAQLHTVLTITQYRTTDGSVISLADYAVQLKPNHRELVAVVDIGDVELAGTAIRADLAFVPHSETWLTLVEPKDVRWGPVEFALAETASGSLTVSVKGLAFDTVVTDETGKGIPLETDGLPGTAAVAIVNANFRLYPRVPVETVNLRCLAGAARLTVGESACARSS